MEKIVPTVNVRQLISAYEKGIPNIYKRPRANSLGNVLGKNVIVRSHNLQTLSDIEDALQVVEENLSSYQVYNKRKHVEFQETLFTLLTSVVNIEADVNDDPVRKKTLITHTQKLVSVLNQKLPNSGSVSSPTTKHNFEIKSTENNTSSLTKLPPPTETQKQILEKEYSISVETIKQNFQSTTRVSLQTNSIKRDSKQKLDEANNLHIQAPEPEKDPDSASSRDDVDSLPLKPKNLEDEKPEEPISVIKLRNLFEQKEKENKTGLELIIKPKTFQYQVDIPYTAGTLGTYRFFRANSGQYMNEIGGVLNRVNMSKAKSTLELNSYSYTTFKEKQEQEEEEDKKSLESTYTMSELSSDRSDCESLESVKEINLERPEIEEDEEENSLPLSISAKEAAEEFENVSKEEEVHIQTADSSEILKETSIYNEEENSLSLSISGKEAKESDNVSKEEEVHIQTAESSEILKESSVSKDSTEYNMEVEEKKLINQIEQGQNILVDDEDVFIQQNGSTEIIENDPPQEITSFSQISFDSVVLREAESRFESLVRRDDDS